MRTSNAGWAATTPPTTLTARSPRPPMRSWSTQDIERRQALAYWVDTVGQALLELESEAAAPERFTATLQQSRLGPAVINLVDASEQWMRRTHAAIARSHAPSV